MISVIVPVNRYWQYKENVLASPGLKEIYAPIIPIMAAENAAEAYEAGCKDARHPWRLFCHQDVWFPPGFGKELMERLGNTDPRDIVGFAGVKLGDAPCGRVLDRGRRLLDWASTEKAISMDELAICLHKDTPLRLDSSLGWHLWATDLCLQANRHFSSHTGARVFSMRNAPHHNSRSGFDLPKEFIYSAKILSEKWHSVERITTLCGVITRSHER